MCARARARVRVHVRVRVRVRMRVHMCVCVCVCEILVPPNNFQTSYPIDMKFWLHTVSHWNSPTTLILFCNFENSARKNILYLIFLHLINMGKFSNSYYASDI